MPNIISKNITNFYLRLCKKNIKFDSKQLNLVNKFDRLNNYLSLFYCIKWLIDCFNIRRYIFAKKSIYIYGHVGCGKSMLMQLFIDNLPAKIIKKMYFYQLINELNFFINYPGNNIDLFINNMIKKYWLICLDELELINIADSMIALRLFKQFIAHGMIIIITSNRHPTELYQNGLNRDSVNSLIDLLNNNMVIVDMNSVQDYRLYKQSNDKTFLVSDDDQNIELFYNLLKQINNNVNLSAGYIKLLSRSIKVSGVDSNNGSKILHCTFVELFDNALSYNDYLCIVDDYDIIAVSNIPAMHKDEINAIRRFITFIDVVYERTKILFLLADVSLVDLNADQFCYEFARTKSRLTEMQSLCYIQKSANYDLVQHFFIN